MSAKTYTCQTMGVVGDGGKGGAIKGCPTLLCLTETTLPGCDGRVVTISIGIPGVATITVPFDALMDVIVQAATAEREHSQESAPEHSGGGEPS